MAKINPNHNQFFELYQLYSTTNKLSKELIKIEEIDTDELKKLINLVSDSIKKINISKL